MNNVVLTGRLTKDPEIIESDNGSKRTILFLAVSRYYKNESGNYETDFIKCVLWNGIAETTCAYCKKGDLVGIRGRIATNVYEKEKETHYDQEIIVERLTFLSSTKPKENENIEEVE